jgi:guanylate kinase
MAAEISDGGPKMIVLTAPSGAGKTTLVKHLLNTYDFLSFSISATSRPRREHEVEGQDYYFMDAESFKLKIKEGSFVEWEEVYENQLYGTLKSEVERIWGIGKHIVFDIDVRGAKRIKELYGNQCLTIFVRPPSIEILIERLTNRGTETPTTLAKRIDRVKSEMSYEDQFDVVIVNDLLEVAKKEAEFYIENFILGKPFIE